MMRWNDGLGWAGWVMMITMMFGVLVLVVGLIVVAFRLTGRDVHGNGWAQPPPLDAAESILAERFARGEIDEEEFRSRIGALKAERSTPAKR